MSLYYFHLTHSEEVRDETGIELASIHAAKCHAVKMVADMLCEEPDWFWETETFRVTVSDTKGMQLVTVEMIATLAPALMSTRPQLRS